MSYLFCALALFMNTVKGYCGKKTSGLLNSFSQMALFNAVRMLICIPVGFVISLANTHSMAAFQVSGVTLAVSAVSGVASATFVLTWLASVKSGSYMMVDVFLTLGVAVPLIACRVVYQEPLKLTHIFGVALLVIAAYIMSSYNNSIGKSKITLPSLLLLVLCGLANGVLSFGQKVFNYECKGKSVAVYNFYVYIFATGALLLFWVLQKCCTKGRKANTLKAELPILKLFLYVCLMSLCLFLNSLFTTMAATGLSATQLYPLTQGGNLILSMLMSALLFGERINKRCILGALLTFVALITINIF